MNTTVPRSPRPPFRSRRAYATFALIGLNVAIHLLTVWGGGRARALALEEWVHSRTAVWSGEYWRLLTGTFLHDGWAHLLLNMFVLQSFGRVVERFLGAWRFLVLYLVSGLWGALFFQASSGAELGMGASGAVVGVVGAFLRVWALYTTPTRAAARWKFLRWIVFLVIADQAFAFIVELGTKGTGIAVSAHLGGLIAGATLAHIFAMGEKGDAGEAGEIGEEGAAIRPRRRVPVLAGFLLATALLGGYACLFTLHDPAWKHRADGKEVVRRLRGGDIEGAVETWRALDIDSGRKRGIGYQLWEELKVAGHNELAAKVLDELAADARSEIARLREEGRLTGEILNEAAWYHALAGTELPQALEYSKAAVEAASEGRRGGRIGWFPGSWRALREAAEALNTQGWIELRLGEHRAGLKHLEEAARIDPRGPNLLYLALAHEALGNEAEAMEAFGKIEPAELSVYEKQLFERLRADLGEI